MGAAGPLLAGGSAVFSAYSAVRAGDEAGDAYDHNAAIAEENAGVAIKESQAEARQIRIIGRKTLGDISANYGASGVTGGSSLDVLADSAAAVERDVHNVEAAGRNRALNFTREAENNKKAASSSRTSGRIGAVAGLLQAGATYSNSIKPDAKPKAG